MTPEERLEVAIARRNITWAEYEAATQMLAAAKDRLPPNDVAEYVRNYNRAQDAFEWAVRELVWERVHWRSATGRDLVTGRLPTAEPRP